MEQNATSHKYEMVAKTFKGLEDVLCDELISLGAENVNIGTRMVSFEGDKRLMYKANLACRTALRILKPIIKFTASTPDELYDFVRDMDWDKYMTPDSTFAIDSTVSSAEFPHSKFVTYRVKDGIVDYFNDKYGRRPSIRVNGADILFNVHIADKRVTLSIDSSGEPLSKRGYRVEQTAAPINEVLAAGIILKTGWRGDSNFVDPMCGSGTFLTEAALIAANINPGIYRSEFAFEKWPDFDADIFEELYNDDSEEREFHYRIYGGDIDPEAIAIAKMNIRSARVENMIELECRSFQSWREVPEAGILITNPPYGERLRGGDIATLFSEIGTELKQYFKGYHAWILGYKDEHFDAIGLRPSVRFPILNGALECSLREYVLFDGKMADFKRDGGSTRNDDFVRDTSAARKRHISDNEWLGEARKFNRKSDRNRRREAAEPDERREFRRDDRKEFRRGDRKDFRRDDRKEFRRDDRKDFRRDDRKEFRRDDRKEFRRDKGRNAGKPRNEAIRVNPKKPGLSADSAFYPAGEGVKMRSRKSSQKPGNSED